MDFVCPGATAEARLASLLADLEPYKVKSWAGSAYRMQGRHLACARTIFGFPDTNIASVEEARSYAEIRFAPAMLSDNVDEEVGLSFLGGLTRLIKRAIVRNEWTASLEMSVLAKGNGGTKIGVHPLFAAEFSDKRGKVRDTKMFANGSISPSLPLISEPKVGYSVALKYYNDRQIRLLSTIVNGALTAASLQTSPSSPLARLTSDTFTSAAKDIESRLSAGLIDKLDVNISGELYLLPRPDQDAGVIFTIAEQKKRPTGAVVIYPHYENSVFVRARKGVDGVPDFADVGRATIVEGPYAKLGVEQYPTIHSYLSSAQRSIFQQLKSNDATQFRNGCDNLEGILSSSFGLQYYDVGAAMWAILEDPTLSYQRHDIRRQVSDACPGEISAKAIKDIGKDFQAPRLGQALVRGEIAAILRRIQTAYDQLTDPRQEDFGLRIADAIVTMDDNFDGVGRVSVTDTARISGNYYKDDPTDVSRLVQNFMSKLAIEQAYVRHGCGTVVKDAQGNTLQAAEFLIANALAPDAAQNKFARVLVELQSNRAVPMSVSVNALDLNAARDFRSKSDSCATALDFALPGDDLDRSEGTASEISDGADDSIRVFAMSGLLDQVPDDFVSSMAKAAKAADLTDKTDGSFIGSPDIVWTASTVTVAFESGDAELFALIEAAAKEWTKHSPDFRFDFRNPDNSFRRWSRNDSEKRADIRISFSDDPREAGYWSYPGAVASGVSANQPTMNYTGFTRELTRFYRGRNSASWLKSYARSTILHEFGHALGLSHEHYHSDCQAQLKFEKDPGYKATLDRNGRFVPDQAGNSPGAILAFSGPPNRWSEWKSLNALNWDAYKKNLPVNAAIVSSVGIDQASVMLYTLEDFLMKGGANSKCAVKSPDGGRYATELSAGDIKYFKTFYTKNAAQSH